MANENETMVLSVGGSVLDLLGRAPRLAGTYLVFGLAGEKYAINILKVKELISLIEFMDASCPSNHIIGYINLHGDPVPIVDLRAKFGLRPNEDPHGRCVIVVYVVQNREAKMTGVLVDYLSEFLDLTEDQIEENPLFSAGINGEFVMGVSKTDQEAKIILDIDRLLS